MEANEKEKLRKQLEKKVLPLRLQEIQFILYCRALGFGTIEKLGIENGMPAVAVTVSQRVDFNKAEVLSLFPHLTQETSRTD